MKQSIKWKFIISYLFITLLMLVMLNTYGLSAIYNRLVMREQTKLYEDAESIVKEVIPDIHLLDTSRDALRKQFLSLQDLTKIRIWIVSPEGRILLDSDSNPSLENKLINQYDPSFLSNQTIVGKNPKGLIQEEMITVI